MPQPETEPAYVIETNGTNIDPTLIRKCRRAGDER
jgi:hypothetical protein